jgi:photosystem II stability/assembly factor-like uncharacterized protein
MDATNGPTWTPITESIGSLAVGALVLDPTRPDTLLLGLGDPFDVHSPGFLHSDDGGASWSAPATLTGTYPNATVAVTASSVRDIAFGAAGSAVVLAATDVGLFRSTERGTGSNWQLIDISPQHDMQGGWSLAWVGGQTWLATTQDANSLGHVWRSTDDGASWAATALPSTDAADVGRLSLAASASDNANSSTARVFIVAEALQAGNTKDVYRSDDGGQSWAGLGVNSKGKPSNPNQDQADLDVMHGQAWYNQMIAVDPQNHDRVVIGGNYALLRSQDGGHSWDVMSDWLPFFTQINTMGLPYVHADWHVGTFAGSSFYGGTDGGIFRSGDLFTAAAGKATFEDRLNRGIVTHLLYSVACGDERSQTSSVVFGGLQDNGTRLRASSGDQTVFNQVIGGDGFGVGIGKATTGAALGTLLVGSLPGAIRRSVDSGANFAAVAGLPADMSTNGLNFFTKVATEIQDANALTFLTMYNAKGTAQGQVLGSVYRSTDGAANWTAINGTIHMVDGTTATTFPRQLNNITANPLIAGQYGVPAAGGRGYVTTDGGANWFQSKPAWSNAAGTVVLGGMWTIAFDPTDATGNTFWMGSKAAVLTDGSPVLDTIGHIFRTTDKGQTWTAMSGSGTGRLPNVPINVIKLDPNDATAIYVGTELGLYRSTDSGQSWARFGTGLPMVSVTDIAVAIDGSAVRVATFGRGFWELYPNGGAPSGVHGSGDHDGNQQIDAFDLVREAALYLTTAADPTYSEIGNLVGTTNAIDDADLTALLAKIGGRP